jgi:hypothetical protein
MKMNTSLISRFKRGLCLTMASAIALGAALCEPFTFTASAQSLQEGYITKSGTGSTSADAIFPAAANAALRLTSYDAKSDLTSATLKAYVGTAVSTLASNALSTATNVYVTAGATNFTAADIVVIQRGDTMSAAIVDSVDGNTNINLTGQIGTAASAGDKIYLMGTVYTTPVQTTNAIRVAGEAVIVARKRYPLLLRITGTSACAINSATAHWDP